MTLSAVGRAARVGKKVVHAHTSTHKCDTRDKLPRGRQQGRLRIEFREEHPLSFLVFVDKIHVLKE